MSHTHNVISAFLDDEPFNPDDLARALSEPDGRALLIDLLALRQLMQPKDAGIVDRRPKPSGWRVLLAAAAVLVAMVGGYFVGQRQIETASAAPPAATRVVEAPTAWQRLP